MQYIDNTLSHGETIEKKISSSLDGKCYRMLSCYSWCSYIGHLDASGDPTGGSTLCTMEQGLTSKPSSPGGSVFSQNTLKR